LKKLVVTPREDLAFTSYIMNKLHRQIISITVSA